MSYIPIADQKDEMHDPHSFIAKYVWSMDHKVIAIQYGTIAVGCWPGGTGLVCPDASATGLP